MSSEIIPVKTALNISAKKSLTAIDFFNSFYQTMFVSLYKPIEGSGVLLYIPAFFYIAIFAASICRKKVFAKDQRQLLVVGTLVSLGLIMFLISLIFYLPFLPKEAAKGVLRYHLNLIPFVNLLAAFICFAALNKLEKKKS